MTRFGLLALVALLLAGCSEGDAATTEAPAPDVVLRVVVGDGVVADWTLAELEQQVPFSELTVDGDAQAGPLLLDVIAASGVGEWDSGSVLGFGEGRVFSVELDVAAADVDEDWILDVTNKGTLKLAAAGLARQDWVRDVGEIRFP